MFVANRYFNSPHIAGAAANLGDALFGSPQREYIRAQTEAQRESTEDRRILRGRDLAKWEALLRATGGLGASTVNTSPAAPVLPSAIEAARGGGGAPSIVAPQSPAAIPMGPTGRPIGSGVLRPEYQTPENFARIAGQSVGGQPAAAAPQPDTLYNVLETLGTPQTPGRIAPDDPSGWLSDVMLAHGPQVAMQMLEAMQGQPAPYEELGVRALLGEQGAQTDFPRELSLVDQRGRYSSTGRGGSGVPLDMTPAEYEKMMDLLFADDRLAGLEQSQMDALATLVSQKYQRSRNFAQSIDEALQESGLLGKPQPEGWDAFRNFFMPGQPYPVDKPWENY